MRKLRTIARETSGWKEADQAMRALLREPESGPAYDREQTVANFALHVWLLRGAASEEQQEAIAFYTGLMLKHRSPETARVQKALERLHGYWPDSRIAEAAAFAAQVGREDAEASQFLRRALGRVDN